MHKMDETGDEINCAPAKPPMVFNEGSFTPPSLFQQFKIGPDIFVLQFTFLAVNPLYSHQCIIV